MSEPAEVVEIGVISPTELGAGEYAELCAALQVPAHVFGYGVSLCVTAGGERLSVLTALGLGGGLSLRAAGWIPLPRQHR